ncbi:uncharacterized protein DUF4145 [Micromonospora pisi]|uniref:Uncharacterized protein DUF4145 n=1 Tax=Micromonospora pisi TaxID=589240 RepID=A0A495JLU0_9ACTN|nr:uncharacterized protein DUF4145 [Micromonospora pisi]
MVCTSCRNATSSVPAGWIGEDEDPTIGYALIECSHCHRLMVIQEFNEWNGQDLVSSGAPVVIWPVRDTQLSVEIPDPARKSFEEARACHHAGQFTAAALMVRRTLEAVCIDKGATTGSLQVKLNELKSKGIIEGKLTDWSHDLRALGNEAAHDTTIFISAADAQDALELAEALLNYVYVLNAKYNAFKARRTTPVAPS